MEPQLDHLELDADVRQVDPQLFRSLVVEWIGFILPASPLQLRGQPSVKPRLVPPEWDHYDRLVCGVLPACLARCLPGYLVTPPLPLIIYPPNKTRVLV